MFDVVISYLISAISACFSWLGSIFEAIPGSWDIVFTVFVILVVSRFLLGSLLGAVFSRGSDRVSASKSKKEEE